MLVLHVYIVYMLVFNIYLYSKCTSFFHTTTMIGVDGRERCST